MEDLRTALSNWLDPQLIGALALTWAGRVFAALLIFFIGRLVVSALTNWFRRAMHRIGMEETLSRFFGSLIYMGLLVMVALSAVAALGVPTTNFLAILGAAGLAIGLALRDSLANVASGVMLVFFRPFKVGDFIEAAGVSGTVETIGIFDTVIKSPDNRVITVPNRLVYSGTIINASSEPVRRIDVLIPISYQDNVVNAKDVISRILEADDRILKQPLPEVVVQDLLPANVNIAVRAWVNSGAYGPARGDLLERIKRGLRDHDFAVPLAPPPPVVQRAAGNE